jgi:elongation factor G
MIQTQDQIASSVIIRAHVPLSEMFGYISQLRSMSKGRASFTMQFDHYEPVPRSVADQIVANSG